VPEGTWTHLLTGEQVTGPRWVHQRHGFDSLPLLVRPDTVLPLGARTDRPDYDYVDGVSLHLYELADGHTSTTHVPGPGGTEGARFTTTRRGATVRVEATGTTASWSVRVAGGAPVHAAAGQGSIELTL
jgi:alpha-D-xyloside xylohydrolase